MMQTLSTTEAVQLVGTFLAAGVDQFDDLEPRAQELLGVLQSQYDDWAAAAVAGRGHDLDGLYALFADNTLDALGVAHEITLEAR